MPITPVQSNHAESAASLGTIPVSLTGVAAGALVVVTVTCDTSGGATVLSVKDDLNVAATQRVAVNNATFAQRREIWRFQNHGGGTRTFTATFSGATTGRGIVVKEYAGAHLTAVDDGVASASNTSATPSSGNLSPAPSVAGELIVGTICSVNIPTAAAPFADVFQDGTTFGDTEDYIQPSAAAIAATWTQTSGAFSAAAASFFPAPIPPDPAGSGGGAMGAIAAFAVASFPSVVAGSTPVSNSFGVQEESGATLSVAVGGIDEALASATIAPTVIEELLASVTQTATPKSEALQLIALTSGLIDEAKSTATGAYSPNAEAAGFVAGSVNGPDAPDFEALGVAANPQVTSGEGLGSVPLAQTVSEEAPVGITRSIVLTAEALASGAQAPALSYEARGIVILPVSNDVVVRLESNVLSITSSGINGRLAVFSPLTALIGPAAPVFAAELRGLTVYGAALAGRLEHD